MNAAIIAGDFLAAGWHEPIVFRTEGQRALALALELATVLGDLQSSVDGLFELTYGLEGREDSPDAARAVRAVMGECSSVRDLLGLDACEDGDRKLRALAKRHVCRLEVARAKTAARAAAFL